MEAFILDPYLFEVAECDNGFKPVSVRENIRANGPTVRTDLGNRQKRNEIALHRMKHEKNQG